MTQNEGDDVGTLNLIQGNLFSQTHDVIAHGVNKRGRFASGFAGEVAKRFPDVKRAYLRKHEKDGWNLGDIQLVQTEAPLKVIVANLCTQDRYGRDGKRYADLDAIRTACDRLFAHCEESGWGVAMPRIGSGLGGLPWGEVEAVLRDLLVTRTVDVEVYYL